VLQVFSFIQPIHTKPVHPECRKPWVLKLVGGWVDERFTRGLHGSDIYLKSRIMAKKLLFCSLVFDFEIRRGASVND